MYADHELDTRGTVEGSVHRDTDYSVFLDYLYRWEQRSLLFRKHLHTNYDLHERSALRWCLHFRPYASSTDSLYSGG